MPASSPWYSQIWEADYNTEIKNKPLMVGSHLSLFHSLARERFCVKPTELMLIEN
jgi:hypothetical protein